MCVYYCVKCILLFTLLQVKKFAWLPFPLPSQCRLILSTVCSDLTHHSLIKRTDVSVMILPGISHLPLKMLQLEARLKPHLLPYILRNQQQVSLEMFICGWDPGEKLERWAHRLEEMELGVSSLNFCSPCSLVIADQSRMDSTIEVASWDTPQTHVIWLEEKNFTMKNGIFYF